MRQSYAQDAELSDLTPTGEPYGEIDAAGLYLALKQAADFGKPIYITENGVPDHDDDVRPRFIATHLAETWRAIQDGADVRGYYHWTLVDNFEWAAAWSLRFGLYRARSGDRRTHPAHQRGGLQPHGAGERRAALAAGKVCAGVSFEAGSRRLGRLRGGCLSNICPQPLIPNP